MQKLLPCVFFLYCFMSYAKKPEMVYVVEAITAKKEPFSIKRRYIGTIFSEYFSLLKPEASGTIDEISVKPEQQVKKGQKLFSLDNAAQKKLVLLSEKHLLLAKNALKRHEILRKTNDISKAELDKALLHVLEAEQKLAEHKRTLNLTEVRAPFDGIVGVPRVVLGQTVSPKDTLISIRKGDYFISFRIPPSRLKEILVGQPVVVKDEKTLIDAVERSVDPVTRTGFARALLKTCHQCVVGSSEFLEVVVAIKPEAILLPKNAIYYDRGKPFVVRIKEENGQLTAEPQEISLGQEQGEFVHVLKGVNGGDKIVKANPKRLKKGAKLRIVS